MGDQTRASFEDEWPHLERELHSMLRRRGVAGWVADDVVQETGIKLWRMWAEVDPDRSVAGLSRKVAVNILHDYWRRTARREVPTTVPDRAGAFDTEREGLARTELSAVGRALKRLQPTYRNVLLAEVGVVDEPTNVRGSALRMLRLRARRELTALVDRASGFAVVLGHRTSVAARNLAGRIGQRVGPRDANGIVFTAVAIATFVVAGAQPGDVSMGSRRHLDVTPVRVAMVPVGASADAFDAAWRIERWEELTTRAVDRGKRLLRTRKDRPFAKARLGEIGEVGANFMIESAGVRVGTDEDGSEFVGCSDGTETGATGLGKCDLGNGETRAWADARYRVGGKSDRVELSTDP